ncbi:protein of unknown function [Modestobacter italicus]|uniref:Integral membrane protein n=1 Tax=Modestobacter italicus (strain DSM 44449 / CECT 9708 / BC 501) TaxID=2732864 RepID=I4EWU4_MODI5|nr:hypothetical protein [Modestobacter marinus]CCH87857.1 protein of unknown function [Modestobacter marinus]
MTGQPSEEVVVHPDHRAGTGPAIRRAALGPGPLRRGSDRLEFLALVLLVCGLLAAALVGVAAARAGHAQARDQAAAAAAERQQVPARLVDEVAAPVGESWDGRFREQWTAVWAGPDGTEHQGTVTLAAGARAGSSVPIWIGRDGTREPPPLSADDVTGRAVGQGLGVFVGLSALLWAAHAGTGVLIERSRSRRWEAEWASVEPSWR